MKPSFERKSMFISPLSLAVTSVAAFLGIMTMIKPSYQAIRAVEDFSLGIPFIFVCVLIPIVEKWPPNFQLAMRVLNLIFVLLGSFFCLLGLHKCFALISNKAAINFAVLGTVIFLLLFIAGIYELNLQGQNTHRNKTD